MSNPNPKVFFLSSHAQSGGSERYLELLLTHLPREMIGGVACAETGPLCGRLEAGGFQVNTLDAHGKLRIPIGVFQFRRLLLKHKPDVVHANGGKAALIAGLAIRGTGIPSIWVKHDYYYDGWPAELAARLNTLVVGVGHGVVETFRSKVRDRVKVVHIGSPPLDVNMARGRATLCSLMGCSREQSEVVVLPGRLCAVKGQFEFVEALPLLLRQRPNLKVALIGGSDPAEPTYAKRVRETLAESSINGRVRLLGHRDDVLSLMAGADLVVITSGPYSRRSKGEGFPYVVLEAMSLGAPVVAYSAGGLPELLDGKGVLVPFGDTKLLFDAIAQVLDNSEFRQGLQSGARDRARAAFSMEQLVNHLSHYYSRVARAN